MRESVASRMVGTVHFGIVQRMTAPRQGDLFGNDGPDPSDDDFETPVYYPDPDKVREELHRILGEARAAKTIPWDANRTALYRTIFLQMTGCLPLDEGARLRFDFETEMARLEAA
jgi:hypothetical protein